MFVILGHFSPFYPTNNPKNENFEKMEKKPPEISPFYTCVPQMTPAWCLMFGAQKILFVIFDFFFYSLTSLTTCNYKIKQKMEKRLQILSFYTCIWQLKIIWRTVPEKWSATDNFFSHFRSFFVLTPQQQEKPNFWKNEKTPADIIILHLYPTMTIIWCIKAGIKSSWLVNDKSIS